MKAILLDIEGTTTPIDFVHRRLFPFAAERMSDFVAANFDRLTAEIEALVDEHSSDETYSLPLDTSVPASVAAYLRHLIAVDRKSTPLKAIQGMIWKAGYEGGELVSEVYEDVPRAFEQWAAAEKTIAIYSSGSVLAQRLLFRYTDHGDLTPFISNYFDTTTGQKREPESYARISTALDIAPADILFVSDVAEELTAAISAGLQAALSVRPGNPPQTPVRGARPITDLLQLDT